MRRRERLKRQLSEEIKEALVKNIRRRITPLTLKVQADIEMKCFQFDGVLHIKVNFTSFLCLFICLKLHFLKIFLLFITDYTYCGCIL